MSNNNFNLISDLYGMWKVLDRSARTEPCSSIRYEARLIANGVKIAMSRACTVLGEQNPLEACECPGCRQVFSFADLENSMGVCQNCAA